MSTLLISLGLKEYTPPKKRDYSHLTEINRKRQDEAYDRVFKIMRDMLMSTSDISYHLGINRDSTWRYMDKLAKKGKAERVGETQHAGNPTRIDVWRLKNN